MRQRFGQNFLVNKIIASKIVDLLCLTGNETVLEIGPGRGVLTELLSTKAKTIVATEIDGELADKLNIRFSANKNVFVYKEDFLRFDCDNPALVSEPAGGTKIIGNLPYNVATPIIEKILPLKFWDEAVFMVQKEVAQRIVSERNSSSYGVFSIICQYYADCQQIFTCGPEEFSPKPLVDSSVITLKNRRRESLDKFFISTIKAAFSQKRKMVVNSLANSLHIQKDAVLDVLAKSSIPPTVRPENLDFNSFQTLTENLKCCIIKDNK